MNEKLDLIYSDPSSAGSYSGESGFIRALKDKKVNATKTQIRKFLQTKDAFTLHKPKRLQYPRKKVRVTGINELWQVDLADLSSLKQQNDGFTFILSAIDVFNKQGYMEKLKNKNQYTVAAGFEKMLKKAKCVKVQVDNGAKFYNPTFKKLLEKHNIKMYSTDSDVKASVVERFQRTIKEKMWRYFTDKQTNRWIDILDKIILAYNDSYHRSIKYKPNEVNKSNEVKVFENLYKYKKNEGDSSSLPKFNYKIGDFVRISKIKKTFEKGYTRNWTREIFVIKSIKPTVPISYKLFDLKGDNLIGSFYEEELQKIDYVGRAFEIDKIIKKKKVKGEFKYFVSWLDYPESFNSWVSESKLKAT